MKILLISYGDVDYDGRLRSLMNVFSQIGEVWSFTRGSAPLNENSRVCDYSYIKFIGEAVRFAKGMESIEWLVLDNRKATIPGMIIRRKCKPTVIIEDCRELYLINETTHLAGKIGCFFEKKMVKKADIVICANQERSTIMQKEYGLKNEPLVYENLRKLEYGSDEEIKKAKEKLDPYIHDNEIRIVSSSGCSIKRTNDVLVRSLENVASKCRLYLVGSSTKEEERTIRNIIKEKGLNNVEILGQLNQNELKYLISKCQIGIVNYGQYDTNNRLCASGKLYEFVFEGVPVVATSNPPLKRLCEKYNIGVADDTYYEAINKVINNYDKYKENIFRFCQIKTIDRNDKELCELIEGNLEQIGIGQYAKHNSA